MTYAGVLDSIVNDSCLFKGTPVVAGNVLAFKPNSTVLVDDMPLDVDCEESLIGIVMDDTMSASPNYGSMCLSVLLATQTGARLCMIPHYYIDEIVA